MASIDHWHPVLLADQLKHKPVAVRVDGQNIVVYRTESGGLGALEDQCPHRRLKLSLGDVVGDKLRCLYHGWTFDTDGYFNICNLTHRVRAPLELVVDNFCEVEHTPTTHAFFGYPLERMHEVQVAFQSTEKTVRVSNHGPRKNFSNILRVLLGIGKTFEFRDDWTTHFSPIYSVYDHWWECPHSGKTSRVSWRLYIFFVPVEANETRLFTFAFTKSRYPGSAGGMRLFRWLMRRKLDYEIKLDVRILEGLADQSTGIEGMKLSRFDKVLGLNRERIRKIYRGVA